MAEDADPEPASRERVRARIVAVAADLLIQGGPGAVTTRAVTAAAGVQAPTIYRLFGDKAGLLDAVTEHGFATYLARKRPPKPGCDPVEALRAGWDLHIEFGLANPALYTLMYGHPRPGVTSPAAAAALDMLRAHVRSIATAGRLRLREEQAVQLLQASGSGTVLALLAVPQEQRDPHLSPLAREACIAAVTTGHTALPAPGVVGAATALRAELSSATALSEAERGVLAEWLDRIAAPTA
ncbi:TetR/AcrR family transcriptional regulator [Mangrovihabitans endophyticus]|uniref:TetR family transcriptional regulator n=1 Tax=Mangrovihabitans endophyticus TaxID=1751298 RepID=A0A8J3FQ76_9ACTN|nr:TetR/AcrR family transcriptional regulator [Mangrovihabitans endophyticus]GGL01140.1 TetR family transcriptional regulator [Mangrovihabitans endophyticus]